LITKGKPVIDLPAFLFEVYFPGKASLNSLIFNKQLIYNATQ